ncbi:ferrous iron transport protein A [Streptomyces sp. NBC_00190]|uniref:ferrous iron transport protein A n=1 Tax=unclassified Streptomyces TaxID=2593676 RepID=UPI002E2AF388|nr:ferrous iron transport protein A [Streptomyces sp. NBC_00190]WSZ38074.1 ferrous iron transport protein A [Streptomyces sp. NBC_00868]
MTGVLGLLLGFFGLPTIVSSPTAKTVRETAPVTATPPPASPGPTAGPTDKQSPAAPLEPIRKTNIHMTIRYYLSFSLDPVTPREGEGDFNFFALGDGEINSTGGTVVRLDPGQQGSLDVCISDTRYVRRLEVAELTPGTQLCVVNKANVGLIEIRALPDPKASSSYLTFDATIWRQAVRPEGTH